MSLKSVPLLTRSFRLIVLFICSNLVLPGNLPLILFSVLLIRAYKVVHLKLVEITLP